MCATANADAGPEAIPLDEDSGVLSPLTAISFRDLWGPTTRPWQQDVKYVAPPSGIVVNELLTIEVNATDSRGAPLMGALVEVAWELDGKRFLSTGRTNILGRVSARRLIPQGCKGKRCLVAVRVAKDQLGSLAYSAFVPR
jgi:hypothetical protein